MHSFFLKKVKLWFVEDNDIGVITGLDAVVKALLVNAIQILMTPIFVNSNHVMVTPSFEIPLSTQLGIKGLKALFCVMYDMLAPSLVSQLTLR